ncbi:MAG: hypothetical protein J6J16_07160 [Lachnospiraceae bacterium]|nr:hypothetical protein [Lachnospiraceae bacterium]
MGYKWQDDSEKLDYTNRKQISFDIDTKVAYKILGNNYNNIYGYIRDYLKNNGFKHIQGSVYQSIEPLKTSRIMVHIDMLVSTYPYLEKCIRDINVTEILEVSNLNYLLSYDGTPGRYEGQYIQRRVTEDFER